jgi:hypothetical protein
MRLSRAMRLLAALTIVYAFLYRRAALDASSRCSTPACRRGPAGDDRHCLLVAYAVASS